MPHRRADGEVVGWVRESGDGSQPMDLLDHHSLAWLTDALLLSVDGAELRVRVTERRPEQVRAKLDDLGTVGPGEPQRWELPLPTDAMRPAPPLTEWPG